jgi:chemotaxis protein CheY-P-specific phosphatase CheC
MRHADATATGPAIDRLCQLAELGAEPAAAALGRLLDTDVAPGAARVLGSGDPAGFHGNFTTVAFDASGDFDGLVAIALQDRVFDFVQDRMAGRLRAGSALAESALREFGNIIASQTVSAIADSLGAKIMLSVPELEPAENSGELAVRVRRSGAPLRIETQLVDGDGGLLALLVIAPDPRSAGSV